MASELTAARQEMRKTNGKLEVVQHQMGDLQKQFTGMQDQLSRMETRLQRFVNSLRRTTEPAVGRGAPNLRPSGEPRDLLDLVQPAELEMEMTRRLEDLRQIVATGWEQDQLPNVSTPEGNFSFPSTGFSVVATGSGEDQLPHAFVVSPTLNNLNPSHGPELARQCPQYSRTLPDMGHSCDLEIPEVKDYQPRKVPGKEILEEEVYGIDPYTHNLPKEIVPAVLNWSIDDKAEEKKGVKDFGDEDKINKDVAVKTNFVMTNVPDEAKFYLTQLYMVGRVDRWLWSTGLFWELPPWPDFCTMKCDRLAQHREYEVIEKFYSVKQYSHSVLDYTDKLEELVKIWPFVNEAVSELIKTSIVSVLEQYRLLVIAAFKFSKLTLGTVAPPFTGIVIIGDCKVESSAFPLKTEDTISETRYPADNWSSCQFALSNGLPVLNSQSVPQSGHEYLEDIIDIGARELELKEFLLSVMREVKDNHMFSQCYLRNGQTLKVLVCPTDKLCIFANVRGERIVSMDVKCCYIVADESVLRLVEKLHLGEYEWSTYSEAFNRACNFASGIVKMGHQLDSRAAIFSDTRAEWIIAAQGCFRQNLTVVTICASPGKVALVHSLNETQVSTLRCDSKQLEKQPAISSKLQSVRHFVYIEDEPVEADTLKQMKHLTTLYFSEVEEFGKTSHTTARLPSSTGLPKGVIIIHGNRVAKTAAVLKIVPKIGTGDAHLAYFLLAHILELAAETVMLASGVAIGYGSALTRTDTRAGEAERGITIQSIGISLFYEMTEEFLKSYKSERLWGENFFDSTTKKWTTMNIGSATCKRGFVHLYYEPIKQIIKTCMNDQKDKLWSILRKLGVTLKTDEKEIMVKTLLKSVMQTCLLSSYVRFEMKIFHLSFPSKTQKYHVQNSYEGPLDNIYATAIGNCDSEGPLMLYVSRMIPASDKGRFFAFGHVFSGKVATGLKVHILDRNYIPGQKKGLYVKSVQCTAIWMEKKQESVEDVLCGNTVVMMSLDQFITNNATLTNEKAYSGKFHSHYQFFYFDSVEYLPTYPLIIKDLKPLNSSYDTQISVFGSKFQKTRRDANVFVVGSGTLGCEFLKNLALMGVSCGHKGTLILIHEDFIAKSNWSRQYLCRDWNIGLDKSTVAAVAACATNSCLHTDTLQNRACPETEYVFPMHAGRPLILSLMHLITSRLGCIWYCLGFLINILKGKYVAKGEGMSEPAFV